MLDEYSFNSKHLHVKKNHKLVYFLKVIMLNSLSIKKKKKSSEMRKLPFNTLPFSAFLSIIDTL